MFEQNVLCVCVCVCHPHTFTGRKDGWRFIPHPHILVLSSFLWQIPLSSPPARPLLPSLVAERRPVSGGVLHACPVFLLWRPLLAEQRSCLGVFWSACAPSLPAFILSVQLTLIAWFYWLNYPKCYCLGSVPVGFFVSCFFFISPFFCWSRKHDFLFLNCECEISSSQPSPVESPNCQ